MNLVLDASVAMRWYFGDGAAQELAYARHVLYASQHASEQLPVTGGLEVANVIARAEANSLVTEARSAGPLQIVRIRCVLS
jgi:predicted nucleic acid-binding protein